MTKEEEKAPENLEIKVSETVGSTDGVGNVPVKQPIIMKLVPWHSKPSREVTSKDIPKILEDAPVMGELCHTQVGIYDGGNALSHCQINNEDPLRFFVSSSGEVIINPVIINHTSAPVDSVEACMSFPEKPPIVVKRYHKIVLRFQQLTLEKELSEPKEEDFSGPEAKVVQHEVAHMNGHSIYDEIVRPEDALGEALLTAKN